MKARLGDLSCWWLQTTPRDNCLKETELQNPEILLGDISELQMACIPNQTVHPLITAAKEWREAADLTLVRSPSCQQNTCSLLIRTTFNPNSKGAFLF